MIARLTFVIAVLAIMQATHISYPEVTEDVAFQTAGNKPISNQYLQIVA